MAAFNSTTAVLRRQLTACELRSLQPFTRPCAQAPLHSSYLNHSRVQRLHTTRILGKKKSREADSDGDKNNKRSKDQPEKQRGGAAAKPPSEGAGKGPTADAADPLEFSDVKAQITSHDERSLDQLKKLKSAGRFNPDSIGGVRVRPDRKDGMSYPLRELAQVVPKGGRTISILVHEKEYIKPIMSAIQASSEFNQQPQRDPDNELELVLKMELEKRDDVAKRVKALCHEWREKVRMVRQKRDKLHATWKKDGLIVPDLKKRADTELEKIIKAKMAEIDAAEKDGLKAAESK